jgi:hypothetical protein
MLRLGFGPELVGQVFWGNLPLRSCLPAGRIGELEFHMMTIGLLVLLGSAMVPLTEFPKSVCIAWIMMIGLAGYYANQAPYVIGLSHTRRALRSFFVQSAFMQSLDLSAAYWVAFSGSHRSFRGNRWRSRPLRSDALACATFMLLRA